MAVHVEVLVGHAGNFKKRRRTHQTCSRFDTINRLWGHRPNWRGANYSLILSITAVMSSSRDNWRYWNIHRHESRLEYLTNILELRLLPRLGTHLQIYLPTFARLLALLNKTFRKDIPKLFKTLTDHELLTAHPTDTARGSDESASASSATTAWYLPFGQRQLRLPRSLLSPWTAAS